MLFLVVFVLRGEDALALVVMPDEIQAGAGRSVISEVNLVSCLSMFGRDKPVLLLLPG